MPHRSEAEALRAQLEERDRELRAAKDELDAAGQLLWEQRRATERVESKHRANEVVLWVSAALVALILVGIVAFRELSSSRLPLEVAASRGPSTAAAPTVPAREPLVVRFTARATAASGETVVRAGDSCVVGVTFPAPGPRPSGVWITCGETALYTVPSDGGGFDPELFDLAPVDGSGDEVRYELVLRDVRARSAAVVRSWAGVGSVESSGVHPFRVDLEVAPTSGPLSAAFRDVVARGTEPARYGEIVRATGATLSPGARCRIALRTDGAAARSRLDLECGGERLFGDEAGPVVRRDGDLVTGGPVDSEGVAQLTLDLAAGTLRMRDPDREIDVALDAPAHDVVAAVE